MQKLFGGLAFAAALSGVFAAPGNADDSATLMSISVRFTLPKGDNKRNIRS
jgi:hypothetical protein